MNNPESRNTEGESEGVEQVDMGRRAFLGLPTDENSLPSESELSPEGESDLNADFPISRREFLGLPEEPLSQGNLSPAGGEPTPEAIFKKDPADEKITRRNFLKGLWGK